MNTDFYH